MNIALMEEYEAAYETKKLTSFSLKQNKFHTSLIWYENLIQFLKV